MSPSHLKILRFGVVGAAVTLSFMGLNWWFAPRLGPDLAYLVAYPLAVGLHFSLNKIWTFRAPGPVRGRQVSEYVVMMVVAFLIQTAVFKALTHFTPLASWLASGVATVAQMGFSFLMMSRRVFAAPRLGAPVE
ncbi:MAG TPA: GtrA family protein [Opitutaceae bacterium]|nr:GtrA family protein [Opitutaceae bacterium]